MCAVVGASTDADHGLTILSVDGIGAYDHVLRAAILTRLRMMPEARKSCLPSDCLAQNFHQTRVLRRENGISSQPGRGREAVISIRIHGALEGVLGHLFDGEHLLEAVLWAFVLARARRGRGTGAPIVPENVETAQGNVDKRSA